MQRWMYNAKSRKWEKAPEAPKKRAPRRKKVTAENKAAETENK